MTASPSSRPWEKLTTDPAPPGRFAVDPRALPFAARLTASHPQWVQAVADELETHADDLATAVAWTVVPDAVRLYLRAAGATSRERVLAGLPGLRARHFPAGMFDQEVFRAETTERIAAHLALVTRTWLTPAALRAITTRLVELAVAGVLTDAAGASDSADGAGANDVVALRRFNRIVGDGVRGFRPRVDAMTATLPQLLGPRLWRDLGLAELAARPAPPDPFDVEVLLGLRGARDDP
jgi:hypothetical protein